MSNWLHMSTGLYRIPRALSLCPLYCMIISCVCFDWSCSDAWRNGTLYRRGLGRINETTKTTRYQLLKILNCFFFLFLSIRTAVRNGSFIMQKDDSCRLHKLAGPHRKTHRQANLSAVESTVVLCVIHTAVCKERNFFYTKTPRQASILLKVHLHSCM